MNATIDLTHTSLHKPQSQPKPKYNQLNLPKSLQKNKSPEAILTSSKSKILLESSKKHQQEKQQKEIEHKNFINFAKGSCSTWKGY